MAFMKILVFTEGTLLMHQAASDCTREEIIRQVKENEESVSDFATYVPTGNAVEKLTTWKGQGAELLYLTSRVSPNEIHDIKNVLKKYRFPKGRVLVRTEDEEYHDIVKRILPDVLIEDNCESIGGVDYVIATHLGPEIKGCINSIVVPEFGGIDHLPDKISALFISSL